MVCWRRGVRLPAVVCRRGRARPPAAARFAVARFAASRFAVARFAASRLAVARFAASRLAVARFAASRFAVARFSVARFAVARSAASRLAASRLAAARLAASRLAASRLAASRLAATRPAATRPAATRSAAASMLTVVAMLSVVAGCSGDLLLFGGESQGPTLVADRPPPVGPPPPQPPTAPPPLTAPPTTAPQPPPTTTEPRTTWSLLAGGDVLMDRSEQAGIDPFEFIHPPLASADLAVVNAEMAISDRGTALAKQYVFRAPPSAAATMAAAGVDVGSLANNHAGDYGPDALLDTIELLEQAGVVALGAGRNADAAYRHRLVDIGDAATVALVGASMIVPWGFEATDVRPGIASTWNTTRVLDSVRAAAGEADVVVAVVHWGIERDPCPSADQRSLARALIGAGADVVIGHHPHVLQPVEFTAGAVVAYSLGNFVWHPRGGFTGETGVLQVDFDAGTIVGWTFHPHLLDGNGAPRPAAAGDRLNRIRAIIGGDCGPHRPPPTTTTPAESEADRGAVDPAESEADRGAVDPAESEADRDAADPATPDEALPVDATP